MPIFIPGTGDGATPNRSLLSPLSGGGALRSAAGRNLGGGSESANADASRDTGVTDCVLSEAFDPLSEVFDPVVLVCLGSASATASAGRLDATDADCPT